MKLYQFAILYHPKARKDGAPVKSEILVKPTDTLAGDEKTAAIIASRQIPEEFMDKLEQVEIAIRPF